jgi:GAF domain-containing protein
MAARIELESLGVSLRRLEQRQDATMLNASLRQLVSACNSLFELQGSGVMLADEDRDLRYAVAADATSQLLEDAQLATGQGPCVDAYLRDDLVASPDVQCDPRWPELRHRLCGRPVRAVLGVPIRLSGVAVGSLDVFKGHRHDWDDSERHALSRFADVAGVMITAAVSAERFGDLADQLTFAIQHRAPIERGVGYLMARDGMGQVEAFNLLRAAARNSRRTMGDVATTLLCSGMLPEEHRRAVRSR